MKEELTTKPCPFCGCGNIKADEDKLGVWGVLYDAIEILTGDRPEKVEENCGTTWFKINDTWYFLSIDECENAELEEIKGERQ